MSAFQNHLSRIPFISTTPSVSRVQIVGKPRALFTVISSTGDRYPKNSQSPIFHCHHNKSRPKSKSINLTHRRLPLCKITPSMFVESLPLANVLSPLVDIPVPFRGRRQSTTYFGSLATSCSSSLYSIVVKLRPFPPG